MFKQKTGHLTEVLLHGLGSPVINRSSSGLEVGHSQAHQIVLGQGGPCARKTFP